MSSTPAGHSVRAVGWNVLVRMPQAGPEVSDRVSADEARAIFRAEREATQAEAKTAGPRPWSLRYGLAMRLSLNPWIGDFGRSWAGFGLRWGVDALARV